MLNLDSFVRSLFQSFYDFLLDEFGVRIGSFRVAIAMTPLAVDWSIRLAEGERIGTLMFSAFFLGVLMRHFYSKRAMQIDNRLQAKGRLAALNKISERFRIRTLQVRLFYLILFTVSGAIVHHFDGFALLDIVFARCIKVRPRVRRERCAPANLRLAHV